MEKINIRCPSCRGLIAVLSADLGHTVQCPLCRKAMRVPAPSDAAPGAPPAVASPDDPNPPKLAGDAALDSAFAPFEATFDPAHAVEAESIFGAPEAASDDVFGIAIAPTIELPPAEPGLASAPHSDEDSHRTVDDAAAVPLRPHVEDETLKFPEAPLAAAAGTFPLPSEPLDAPAAHVPEHSPPDVRYVTQPASEAWPPAADTAVPQAADEVRDFRADTPAREAAREQELTSITPTAAIRQRRPSMVAPILLIFLIPYSICTTGVIGWLLATRTSSGRDPLERMLEENQRGNEIERIKHDLPVPNKLRVSLGETLQVGAVEVRPLKVVGSGGDLALVLRIKNVSTDLKFNPLPAEFARMRTRAMRPKGGLPYTFLEGGGQRIYGGDLEWLKGPVGAEQVTLDPTLLPGEEMTVRLMTDLEERKAVPELLKAGEPLLWRVQLRRGLEPIGGRDRVITCVIGVVFSPEQIEKT